MTARTPPEVQEQIIRLLQNGKSRTEVRRVLGLSDEAIKTAMKMRFGHNRVTEIREDLRLSPVAEVDADEWESRLLLESIRWPDGARCPKCGGEGARIGGHYGARGNFKCADCRGWFTVLSGTGLHNNKTPVHFVVYVLKRVCAVKDGVSQRQIARVIGIDAKTAMGLVLRIMAITRVARGGEQVIQHTRRYTQEDFWRDLEWLRRRTESDMDAADARFYALCNAIFGSGKVVREEVSAPDKTRRFGRFRNVPINYKGKKKTAREWAKEIGVDYPTFMYRLNAGWPMDDVMRPRLVGRRSDKCNLKPKQVAVIKAMLAHGRQATDIAKVYNVPYPTVSAVKNGASYAYVDAAPLLPVVQPESPLDVARRLRAEGLPFHEIGRRIGFHTMTVHKWLRRDQECA